jgi:predicted transcriptional regulator
MKELEFQTALQFFKALANEKRLKILGILASRECSVEELATLLELKEPTVSHHLARLKALDLVEMRSEGNTHLYRLHTDGLHAMSRHIFTSEKMATLVADDVEYDVWEQKVLQSFFDGERLTKIPTAGKKRMVVLRWLVNQFEPDRHYPEPELNEIIKRHHPDCATIRREFIGSRLMERKGGVYWRVD